MSYYTHEQVDSGLGFTCDKGIKNLVVAFNQVPGMKSFCSCERSKNLKWLWIEFDATRDAIVRFQTALAQMTFVSIFEVCTGQKHIVHGNWQVLPENEPEALIFLKQLAKEGRT